MNILSRLRALWNYDPVAMQKAMLREVWARRASYRPEAKRAAKRALLDRLNRPIYATFRPGDMGAPLSFGDVRHIAPISTRQCRDFGEAFGTRGEGASLAASNAEYERNFKRIMEDFP